MFGAADEKKPSDSKAPADVSSEPASSSPLYSTKAANGGGAAPAMGIPLSAGGDPHQQQQQQQPPSALHPQMYPYTTCWVKPRYIPVQTPGGKPLDIPAYDVNAPNTAWSSNLCDCMRNPSVCIEVAVCPWLQTVRQTSLMWHGRANPCCGWYPIYFLLDLFSAFFLTPGISSDIRVRVAQYFHINMSEHGTECLKGYFCCFCSLCQTYRELDARGINPGLWCTAGHRTHAHRMLPFTAMS